MRAWMRVAVLTLASGWAMGQDVTVPAGHPRELLRVSGVGVQMYACKQMEGGPGWSFVAPEATLMDGAGKTVGRHGAGPTWMLSDGSSVKGKVAAQQISTEEGAVPWLLLEAVEPKGPGMLAGVRWIRRSETHGGKARMEGCDATRIGQTDRVAYRATYTFFGGAGF